jgi:hypothetical protein
MSKRLTISFLRNFLPAWQRKECHVDLKAISIQQPWAWLIVNGIKDIENRTWATRYRGPLLILASQKPCYDYAAVVKKLKKKGYPLPDSLDRGGIVGIVDLVDCVTHSRSTWFQGPYGFVLENARTLPYTPWKGKLGLFNVPQDAAQLEHAVAAPAHPPSLRAPGVADWMRSTLAAVRRGFPPRT